MIDLSDAELFVFDFDGTLVQSNAIKRAAFYEVVAALPEARSMLDRLLRAEPRLDRFGIFEALAGAFSGLDAQALALAYTNLCETRIVSAPEVPGALALLQALRGSGRICVINSATPESALHAIVSRMPIARFVHATYGRPSGKTENVKRAMNLAAVPPQQVVVVGDGEEDRMAAVAVGCRFIGVKSDGNDFREAPPILVPDLQALRDAFSIE